MKLSARFLHDVSLCATLHSTKFPIHSTVVLILSTVVLIAGIVPPASAQLVRVRSGAGLHVNAPYANIHVRPRQSATPIYRVPRLRGWGRRLLLGRQLDPRVATQPLEPKPDNRHLLQPPKRTPQVLDTPQSEALQTPASNSHLAPTLVPQVDVLETPPQFPTSNDLAQLEDPSLVEGLLDISQRLDSDLAQLDTGAGWQRYLSIPAEHFFPFGNLGISPSHRDDLQKTLDRFENVVDNPKFHTIANRPTFIAASTMLREVAVRVDRNESAGPASKKPTDMPTSKPNADLHTTPGEHSILKNTDLKSK